MIDYAKKYAKLGFDFDLVNYPDTRKKRDIMSAIANVCRYLDLKNDTRLYSNWKDWLVAKEITWKTKYDSKRNFLLSKKYPIAEVMRSLNKVDKELYSNFAKFKLISGLRTNEARLAWENHDDYCDGKIMELWFHSDDGKNKKANACYCHPMFHEMKKEKIVVGSRSGIYKHLAQKELGFTMAYLRAVSYSYNLECKLDISLVKFMQGRKGDVSDKFYYLPIMEKNYKNWLKNWNKILF